MSDGRVERALELAQGVVRAQLGVEVPLAARPLARGEHSTVVLIADEPRSDAPPVELVAKLTTPERAARAWAAAGAVRAALDGGPVPDLSVPVPLASDLERGIVVESRATGARLDHLTRRGGEPAVAGVERLGRALARLHRLDVDLGAPRGPREALADIVRPDPTALAEPFPEFAALVAEVRHRLVQAGPGPVSVPLHRDPNGRNAFVEGEFVRLVDWDDAAAGEPEFDLAYAATYLETHGADPALPAVLFRGYAAAGGFDLDPARVRFYREFNLLRRACRRLRLRDGDWRDIARDMLRRLGAAERPDWAG